ncbi:NAD-dependent epimerase/dehydratase family protein [Moraxella sp. ZY200743]|uniref:NAD-dependent epimerase/dehydratase family protein n=1 Tax=Moraxella sp. ZY200743 TaxID=2911970 RepID=UPI003D7E22E1
MKRKAILIGSSNQVGQVLMQELGALYDTLIVITRTQPYSIRENTHIYHVQNFDSLSSIIASIPIGADTDAFSCLDMDKKDAVSFDEFYQVNVLFNLDFAKSCLDKGVARMFYLSQAGVHTPNKDPKLTAKADVEQRLQSLGFDKLVVFRPHKLTLPKNKLSLKNAKNFSLSAGLALGLNLAKNTVKRLESLVLLDKQTPLSPKRVATAMSLIAYRLHQDNKYHKHSSHFWYLAMMIFMT